MDRGHAIKLLGKINPEQQDARAEALSWTDKQGSIRTLDPYRIGADPGSCRFSLKSADKFGFRHDAPPLTAIRRGTHQQSLPLSDSAKQQSTIARPSMGRIEFS
jgi:hypothetical protein